MRRGLKMGTKWGRDANEPPPALPDGVVALRPIFTRTRAKTARSRDLRANMTDAERILWSRLKGGQVHGASFRRQHAAGPYVLDFYCPALKLAIELDGGQHGATEQARRDEKRDAWFAAHGVATVRFWNFEVTQHLGDTMDTIGRHVEQRMKVKP